MTDYYFGEGGSDANSGLSYANRKATYADIVTDYSPGAGDTVYICTNGAGTWTCTEQINMRSGSSGNPFVLAVYPGHSVLMDVADPGSTHGAIRFSSVNYASVIPGQGTLELGDTNDWSASSFNGYTADRQIHMDNSTYISLIGTGTGRWDTTDSNFKIHGGRNWFGNMIDDTCDHIYLYGIDTWLHGTIDTNASPPTGQPNQDWGDMWAMYGNYMYIHRCAFKEGGHNNVETLGHYVIYDECEFDATHRSAASSTNGHLAMRASDMSGFQQSNGGTSPWGPQLMQHTILRNANSADQRDQTTLKIDTYGAIFRGNYIWDCVDRIWQSNVYNELGGPGTDSRIKIYHNSSYNTGAIGSNRTAGAGAPTSQTYMYLEVKNNIFDWLGQPIFDRPHWWRYAAPEATEGYPNGWKGAQINGNIARHRTNADVTVRLTDFGFSVTDTTFSGARTQWPEIFGAANRMNYITAPTYAGNPASGARTIATFAPGGGYETGMAVPISNTRSAVSSSTSIPLQLGQASSWCDGWDLSYFGVTGDTIYFPELDETRVVTNVNITTDTITVDSAVTLSNGAAIYWVPDGTNPAFDIGAGQSNAADGGDETGGGTGGGSTPPPAPGGTGDITYVGAGTPASQYEASAGSGITLGFPTGLADGDLMIAVVTRTDDNGTMNTPTGWTKQLEIDNPTDSDCSMGIFTKIASSESGTVTFDNTDVARQSVGGVIVAYRGVDQTTPIDVTPVAVNNTVNSATGTPGAITTVTNRARVVVVGSVRAYTSEAASFSPPNGYTERVDYSATDSRFTIADIEVATAGTETPGAITASPGGGTTDWCLGTLALRPATTSPTVSSSTQVRVSMKIGLSGTITL